MSILDRVTKAVGDAVDRGKKEVDQFVRIQKINSQIGELEKKADESRGQIQQAKLNIGELAISMLQAGKLASPEMNAVLDQIAGIEQRIASTLAEISRKKAEIESIKSEDKAAKPEVPSAEAPPAPAPQPSVTPAAVRSCPQCGAAAGSGAFCGQCGSRLT